MKRKFDLPQQGFEPQVFEQVPAHNLRVSLFLDNDGNWMQITTRGYEKVDFSGFENFNKRSGGLGDTLIYVTARPRLAKKLFIKTAKISALTDKETSIFFEPVCQTAKIFNGKYKHQTY